MLPSERLNRAVSITAAALTIGLAGATAHAAIYTGSFDPAYGNPFPNLGYKGTAQYFVPDSCVTSQTGTFACGGAMVQSAQVSFYCLALANCPIGTAGPSAIVETLNLSGTGNNYSVSTITLTGGVLTGVTSGFGPAALARSSIAGSGTRLFSLSFNGSGAVLAYLIENETSGKPIYHLGTLPNGQTTPAANVIFTPVPEPTTLALWAAGLAGIGAVVRRRQRG